MKRQFCLPCFLELQKAGKHNIKRVGGGVNMKVTCWRCKRRRYTHVFKKPFEYSGTTYTELTFDFERLTGRDMVSIETEMQMNNEYALAPEFSRNFQSKMAAKAAGIGSDVLDAMPIKDFNRITNAARDFLLNTGY